MSVQYVTDPGFSYINNRIMNVLTLSSFRLSSPPLRISSCLFTMTSSIAILILSSVSSYATGLFKISSGYSHFSWHSSNASANFFLIEQMVDCCHIPRCPLNMHHLLKSRSLQGCILIFLQCDLLRENYIRGSKSFEEISERHLLPVPASR